MKKLIFILLLGICSNSAFPQARLVEAAKGFWNVTHIDLTSFTGMPTTVWFSPNSGVKGNLSLSFSDEISDNRKYGIFNVRMSGFKITHVYNNGKWYSINQVRKCTDETIYQISKANIQVEFYFSVQKENLPILAGTRTITLCTGYGGGNCGSQKLNQTIYVPHGYTVSDMAMPFTAKIKSEAFVSFINTPKISANRSNISANCPPPKNNVAGLTVEETYEKPDPEDEPKPKPGMSITESIKAKMPLYAEGNRCISLHHLDGGPQCDDNAIEIRNNCGKVMTVQLALKQKSGHYASEIITTLQSAEKKNIQTGCDKVTKGAKFVAISRQKRANLLCRPEWYLISMMDLKGKPYVDVPYEAPKKKPTSTVVPGSNPKITFNQSRTQSQQTNGASLGDVYFPNANKTKTYQGSKAKEFQKNMNNAAFDITNGFFGHKKKSGSLSEYTVYRFGNQSWSNGSTWFKAKVWADDPSGYKNTSSSYWTFYGKWEKKGNEVILTRWEVGRQNPSQNLYVFKIEGKNLRLIKGPSFKGTQPPQDDLYTNYSSLPNWPKMNEKKSSLTSGFLPRN